jgi:hypothetical protein
MPSTDSDPAEVTLSLAGVWLHDPLDEEGTAANFPYGPGRESSVEAAGVGTLYAGRVFPVYDYGEHEEESVSASIQVPHGDTYASDLIALDGFARAKRVLWYRDNRGRSFAAAITSHKVSDQRWGALVALSVARHDYAVDEVA